RGDPGTPRSLAFARSAAPHAGGRVQELEATEHGAAAVALERADGVVEMRVHEGHVVRPGRPIGAVDLSLMLDRLLTRSGPWAGAGGESARAAAAGVASALRGMPAPTT